MIIPQVTTISQLLLAIVVPLSVVGYAIARHIGRQKKKAKPFVCPLNFDCHTVVHSEYSKFLGIPLEFLGALYYALSAFFYTALLLYPSFLSGSLSLVLLAISACALLFSIWLTYLQAHVIKEWCSWCLMSALVCGAIFTLVLSSYFLH